MKTTCGTTLLVSEKVRFTLRSLSANGSDHKGLLFPFVVRDQTRNGNQLRRTCYETMNLGVMEKKPKTNTSPSGFYLHHVIIPGNRRAVDAKRFCKSHAMNGLDRLSLEYSAF